MSETEPEHTETTSNATSEVATEPTASGTSTTSESNNENKWRLLFELQNERLMALIKALQSPSPNSRSRVVLPEFNPDKDEVDARSWCATADICFTEKPLAGGELIMAISGALKGAASAWLSQICFPGITWPEFKNLFTQRFVNSETCAGSLIIFHNSKPNDNESLAAYASRLITSLLNRWKGASKEEIAVSTVLAHVSKFDNRLQRLAFTTDITSRDQLQKELQAFTFLKRKANDTDKFAPEAKQSRFTQPFTVKCFECGKFGHKQIECHSEKMDFTPRAQSATPGTSSGHQPGQRASGSGSIVCFRCNATGHTAARCSAKPAGGPGGGGAGSGSGRAQGGKPAELRVDQCVVDAPTGIFEHND